MKVVKVKRSVERNLCEYCGEALSLGRHGIPLDMALRTQCPKCKKNVQASCMLGLGHFFFVCEHCGHKWSNIE